MSKHESHGFVLDEISMANEPLLDFMAGYLESSSGLATAALSAILDYCERLGITQLSVAPEKEGPQGFEEAREAWRRADEFWCDMELTEEGAER